MEIVMISGKSASGKDTLASIMREKLEKYGCKCLTVHLNMIKSYINSVDYSTKYIRDFLTKIFPYDLDLDIIFIPDIHFEEEINIIKKYNPQAITIRIERFNKDVTPYINPELTPEENNCLSETALDDYEDFDYFIENYTSNWNMLKESAETILADSNLLR